MSLGGFGALPGGAGVGGSGSGAGSKSYREREYEARQRMAQRHSAQPVDADSITELTVEEKPWSVGLGGWVGGAFGWGGRMCSHAVHAFLRWASHVV